MEISVCCDRISCVICHIVVLNHSYVLTSVERAKGFIESREILGSDKYIYPGRSPARGVSGSPGSSPARIVLDGPGEARLG